MLVPLRLIARFVVGRVVDPLVEVAVLETRLTLRDAVPGRVNDVDEVAERGL
jgi:hypothetical protein